MPKARHLWAEVTLNSEKNQAHSLSHFQVTLVNSVPGISGQSESFWA